MISSSDQLALDLQTVKNYLKITYDDENSIIIDFIRLVTKKFEDYTGIILINQIWQYSSNQLINNTINLPISNVTKIETIEIIDAYQQSYVLPHYKYQFFEETKKTKFLFIPSGKININFIAGFGTNPESIPINISFALLEHIGCVFDNRSYAASFDLSIYDEFKILRL